MDPETMPSEATTAATTAAKTEATTESNPSHSNGNDNDNGNGNDSGEPKDSVTRTNDNNSDAVQEEPTAAVEPTATAVEPTATTVEPTTTVESESATTAPFHESGVEGRRPRRSRVAAIEAMAKTKEQSEAKSKKSPSSKTSSSSTTKPSNSKSKSASNILSEEAIAAQTKKQEALEKLNIGRLVEGYKHVPQTGQYYPHHGTILEKRNKEGRIPDRWVVQWKDPYDNNNNTNNTTNTNNNNIRRREEWTHSDLKDHDLLVENFQNPFRVYNGRKPEKNKLSASLKHSLEELKGRYHKLVLRDIQHESFNHHNNHHNHHNNKYNNNDDESASAAGDLLPTLVLLAALEDALQTSLQYQRAKEMEQLRSEGNETTTITTSATSTAASSTTATAATSILKKHNKKQFSHPPLYYTTNPNHYLVQPSREADAQEDLALLAASRNPKATMTPALLGQRIRDGCHWAWTYLQQQQQQQQQEQLQDQNINSNSKNLATKPLDAPGHATISATAIELEAKKAQEALLLDTNSNNNDSNNNDGNNTGTLADPGTNGDASQQQQQQQRRSIRSGLGERTTSLFDPTGGLGGTSSGRRSTRGGGGGNRSASYNDFYVPEPTPVQKGGRIALWWLETLRNEAKQQQQQKMKRDPKETKEENKNDTEILAAEKNAESKPDTKEPKPLPDKSEAAAAANMITGDSYEDAMGGAEDEETATKDDDEDEDFDMDGDEEENESDDQLENVCREGSLTPVPDLEESGDDSEEDDSDDSDDEVDEEHAIVWDNPYLTPSFPAVLEYLSKPKSISGEDVQKAMDDVILRHKHNKRTSGYGLSIPDLRACDKALLHWENPDHPPFGSLVLKCVSGEKVNELQRMDAQNFGRCKFELEIIGAQEKTIQIRNREDFEQRSEDYKIRKAHDKWRFKGVHEGHAFWPQWKTHAREWIDQNVVTPTTTTTTTIAAAAAVRDEATTNEATTGPTDTANDEALAKRLAETATKEEASLSRRTARRSRSSRGGGADSGGGGGVFYGNQSSMTQKQLMDALIRLVKTQGMGSLCGLQELVSDDSSDPLRRIRIALGKILWKQNRLAKLPVSSVGSDKKLLTVLDSGKHLLALKQQEEAAEEQQQQEQSSETTGLLDYLSHLHATELRLRDLVLTQLGRIPLAVIATAADERRGTLENMDAGDFEEPSTIEWKTSGNEWISKLIYRPNTESTLGDETTPCYWYEITSWSESIASEEVTDDGEEAFERRKRFQASPQDHSSGGATLLLTEAQVSAGKQAADLQEQRGKGLAASQPQQSSGNPFATEIGDRITLLALDDNDADASDVKVPLEISGRVVGQDTVFVDPPDDADSNDVEYRILILPDDGPRGEGSSSSNAENPSPFWAVLDIRADDSSFVCQPQGQKKWYSIENQDFHVDSEPYKACQGVLEWLSRQSKAGPFMEPVDPVALGIPSYPSIVKHPMDISTMMEKLESGAYSNILPGQSVGNSLVCRMLNGPFRKDIELIFDNAMLFNPPDDWIAVAAAQLKKSATKKIDTLAYAAEKKNNSGGGSQRKSIYADEDSDVDMYEYESDHDEEYTTGRGSRRKRKRSTQTTRAASNKDEAAARPMENQIRLQNCLKDGNDLRGRFSGLPLNGFASTYSMPPKWSCKKASSAIVPETDKGSEINDEEEEETPQVNEHVQEMADLLAMQRKLGEAETSNLRRSSRETRPTAGRRSNRDRKKDASKKTEGLEYYLVNQEKGANNTAMVSKIPSSRLDVEVLLEKRHEEYYAKLYNTYEAELVSTSDEESNFALYSNGAFPPYLGRVVPAKNQHGLTWEIRPPFVVPALRWVLRGLIVSGHLTAIEPMFATTSTTGVGSYDYTTSGVIISNDVYYYNPETCKPFEVLDTRVLQRKKRAGEADDSSEEDEVEMSEYEKLRAERVARNAERLKLLGLA